MAATNTARSAGTTGAACARACCGGFGILRRVDAGLDRGLQFLDISEIGIGRRIRRLILWIGLLRVVGTSNHLLIERHAAITAEREFLPVGEINGYRAAWAGNQLFTGIDTVSFGKGSTRSIAGYRKHFADNLTDDTDQSSHDSFLRTTTADHRRHVSKGPNHLSNQGMCEEKAERSETVLYEKPFINATKKCRPNCTDLLHQIHPRPLCSKLRLTIT
nr:hypothetical protein [Pseudomonas alcaligenes]